MVATGFKRRIRVQIWELVLHVMEEVLNQVLLREAEHAVLCECMEAPDQIFPDEHDESWMNCDRFSTPRVRMQLTFPDATEWFVLQDKDPVVSIVNYPVINGGSCTRCDKQIAVPFFVGKQDGDHATGICSKIPNLSTDEGDISLRSRGNPDVSTTLFLRCANGVDKHGLHGRHKPYQ